MKKTNRLILSTLIFLLLIVQISYAKAPEIVLNQKKAVVTIYVNDKDGKQIVTGSGFIVDPDGIIATNYHIAKRWIDNAGAVIFFKMENEAFLFLDPEAVLDNVVSHDKDNDIAILRVAGKGFPAVKLATDYKPNQGEEIFVIGSPMGLETTVSNGIISSLREKAELIQITAPVSPGSSGSPVFDSKGEVIGVATFLIEGGQNLNFAIPIKHVKNLIEKAKKGELKKGRITTDFKPLLPPPDPESPARLLEAGKQALEDKKHSTLEMLALFSFKKLIKQYPGSPEALIALDIISQKRWFCIENDGGMIQFIDARSIRHVNENTDRVVIKMVPLKGSEAYLLSLKLLKLSGIEDWKDYGYTLFLKEIDHVARRTAILGCQEYNNDDRILYIMDVPKKWENMTELDYLISGLVLLKKYKVASPATP